MFRFFKKAPTRQLPSFLAPYIGAGDIVFDVGANRGEKAETYLATGASLVCFEPQPHCVEALRRKFHRNGQVTIVEAGLADKPGELPLSICSEADTITTFSDEWKQGRFANYQWDQVVKVKVMTLDQAIREYGEPAYCKIDVEGFELQVLQGLSRPLRLLSFEFACEFLHHTAQCVDHLQQIGFNAFNFAQGEEPTLASQTWLSAETLIATLHAHPETQLWGDIYAKPHSPSRTTT